MRFRKLLEWLGHMEHEQWMVWSRTLANSREKFSDSRLKRWKKLWKPYSKLTVEQKEQDREWAQKIIDEMPFNCPVWQCGGIIRAIGRKPPKGFVEARGDGYDGDFQTPDLVCENCRAVYRFSGFRRKRSRKSIWEEIMP
jgi:hypothetical protein